MQARTLEEIELQQPFFQRVVRPLAGRMSGVGRKLTGAKRAGRAEQRLAMAGNPGDLRTTDFLGLKAVVALGVAAVAFVLLGLLARNIGFGIFAALGLGMVGFFAPEYWLSRRIKSVARPS